MRQPSWPTRASVWTLIFFAGASPACRGVIGDADDRTNPGNRSTGSTSPTDVGGFVSGGPAPMTVPSAAGPEAASDPQAPPSAATSPLRRLGKTELLNTLRDLFPGLPASFASEVEVPADNDVKLAFALPGTVSDLEVKRFMDLAEAAIDALGPKAPNQTFDCAGLAETVCARRFVDVFGKRVYRRPPSEVEAGDLMSLYTDLRSDSGASFGFRDALGVLIEAMLQSPGFLYRWERGLAAPQMDGALVQYDDYEMASRLSYFLWNSMPDDRLLGTADSGRLKTPDEIAAQATRLLSDPRADATLADFVTQWLELGPLYESVKDQAVYPAFKPELLDSMRKEAVALSTDVLRGADPTFANLLTARYTFVDASLADYYGVHGDGTGRADLMGTARLGLLTGGALMAVKGNSYRTSPVRRGKFILNRLLCTIIPPPPPNVVPELPPPDPTKTLREQMAIHRADPSCATCHARMDPLGFAFEHFDGAGKYRADDGGHPIDASGSIELDGESVDFRDATELAEELARSRDARACFARQWLRYALDRFEQNDDRAAVGELVSFYADATDTKALIVRIARSLPFTHRALSAGEGVP